MKPAPSPARRAWARNLRRILALAMVCISAFAIANALKGQGPGEVAAALASLPFSAIAGAAALVALNFGVLSLLEWLAMRDAGVRVRPSAVVLSAFVGNAMSLAVGMGPLSGALTRERLFRAWGLPMQSAAVTAFDCTFASLAGGGVLAGFGLMLQPEIAAHMLHLSPPTVRILGGVGLLAIVAVVVSVGRLRVGAKAPTELAALASAGLGAVARICVGAVDWLISANVLYLLVAASAPAGLSFVGAFAAAHFLGMAAAAPAGLGVFDALIMHAGLGSGAGGVEVRAGAAGVAASLLLYRLIANIAPALLAVALYVLVGRSTASKKAPEPNPDIPPPS